MNNIKIAQELLEITKLIAGDTKELSKEWNKANDSVQKYFNWCKKQKVSRKTLQLIVNAQTELAQSFRQVKLDLDLEIK